MTHKQNSQLFFPMSHTSSNYVGLINKEFINKFSLLLHKIITTFNAKSIYALYSLFSDIKFLQHWLYQISLLFVVQLFFSFFDAPGG